jgi:hypothetical protein
MAALAYSAARSAATTQCVDPRPRANEASLFGANLCSVGAVPQSGWGLALILALCCLVPSGAAAQDEEAREEARCVDFGLDDADVTARLHDIRTRIERHEPDMRHWLMAFAVLHGALFGGEMVLGLTANGDGPRNEAIIGAISSGLGLVTLLTSFPPLVGAGGQLDAMPEDTPEQRVAKLVHAERLLRESAAATAFVRGPVASLLSAGYVAIVASLLATVFERTTGAYVLAAGGVVLGQGRLLLHPDGILHEWRRYLYQHPDAGCEPEVAPPTPSIAWQLTPTAVPGGGGIGFSLRF